MKYSRIFGQTGANFMQIKDLFNPMRAGGIKRVEERKYYYNDLIPQNFDRKRNHRLGRYFYINILNIVANLETASSDLNWDLIRYAEVL